MTYPSIDIIHGDIKPANILIFKDSSRHYVAKVADFGFSTCFRGDHDLISMPKSIPWNAPEYHYRSFEPPAAKRMDIYSFGMLCLWLIFGVSSSATMPLPPQTPHDKGHFICFEDTQQKLNLLQYWKSDRNNKLLEWVTWLVVEHGCFKNEMSDRLSRFFNLTLVFEPEKREINIGNLLHFLSPTR